MEQNIKIKLEPEESLHEPDHVDIENKSHMDKQQNIFRRSDDVDWNVNSEPVETQTNEQNTNVETSDIVELIIKPEPVEEVNIPQAQFGESEILTSANEDKINSTDVNNNKQHGTKKLDPMVIYYQDFSGRETFYCKFCGVAFDHHFDMTMHVRAHRMTKENRTNKHTGKLGLTDLFSVPPKNPAKTKLTDLFYEMQKFLLKMPSQPESEEGAPSYKKPKIDTNGKRKITSAIGHLALHTKTASGKEIYICRVCSVVFDHHFDMLMHTRTHESHKAKTRLDYSHQHFQTGLGTAMGREMGKFPLDESLRYVHVCTPSPDSRVQPPILSMADIATSSTSSLPTSPSSSSSPGPPPSFSLSQLPVEISLMGHPNDPMDMPFGTGGTLRG